MYLIKDKIDMSSKVSKIILFAKDIVKHAEPGQFVILRVDELGERIPLTIADIDQKLGTISIIFQIVGATTYKLNQLKKGDYIMDLVGPLGKAMNFDGLKKVLIIGGGLGCAILYPIIRKLNLLNIEIDSIIGFKSKDFIFLEDEFKKLSDEFYLLTDDGSKGIKGLVTDQLKIILENNQYDEIITIGPLMMMKHVAIITKEKNIKTICSMNPIMVDGTGMCGGCRVKLNDGVKFACVDGPEFDAHQVDFDLAIKRNQIYHEFEEEQYKTIIK
jgi:ferredoxin/flavodoxin---NADP+ reductase